MHPLLDVEHLILQVGAGDGIDRAEGFVHQEERRIGRHGAGDADALLLATRELARPPLAILGRGEVDQVEKLIDSMFARAMSDGEPTEDQYHIARVISDVWLSNLLAWLTRRASATDVSKRLDLAVRLLIGDTDNG